MRRVTLNNGIRRFGYKNPHHLNSQVGYRGGIRF